VGLKPRKYVLPPEFQEAARAERERELKAVEDFVQGAVSADLERMGASLDDLEFSYHEGGGWAAAFSQVSAEAIPQVTKEFFLRLVLRDGDSLRQAVGDDRALVIGFRALLPPHEGPEMKLYRGTAATSLTTKEYGASWTTSIDAGRAYAKTGMCRTSSKGSVLLSAIAPAGAILCAPAILDDSYDEQEYIVDPERLREVQVEEEFPGLSHEELQALRAETRKA